MYRHEHHGRPLHDLHDAPFATASAVRKSVNAVSLETIAGVAFAEHPSTSAVATTGCAMFASSGCTAGSSMGPPPDETQFLAPAQVATHGFEYVQPPSQITGS